MKEEIINPDEIMNKARDVIESGKFVGSLSEHEENWLKENGGVIYAVYKMSTEARKKDLEMKQRREDYDR